MSIKEEEKMTYEEVKEYFEYSTWGREPAYGGTCFTSPDKVLYIFFVEQEKAIDVAFYGPEGCYHMVIEIDPKGCKYRNSGNFYMGPITIVAPRDTEKIKEDF